MKHGFGLIRAMFFIPGMLWLAGCGINSGQISYYSGKQNIEEHNESEKLSGADDLCTADVPSVYVSITGAIVHPGVYIMPIGSRVFDVINAAGGIVNGEEISDINLVYIIEDGMQIHIARKDESTNAVLSAETIGVTADSGNAGTGNANGLVDINTANAEKLMTLTGIGKTRAEAIIAYREAHGRFYAIDEIMNVSGIKEATYEKIKDKITIK